MEKIIFLDIDGVFKDADKAIEILNSYNNPEHFED